MSSYTAKMNRLKQNIVKDHPKNISGMTVMARKVAANKSGSVNDSSLGPRILNNFSLMKRRTGCCVGIVKDSEYVVDAGDRTLSLGDKLFNSCGTKCAPVNPYVGKSYGCCETVKKVAVAQDYNERIRRLKSGAVVNK